MYWLGVGMCFSAFKAKRQPCLFQWPPKQAEWQAIKTEFNSAASVPLVFRMHDQRAESRNAKGAEYSWKWRLLTLLLKAESQFYNDNNLAQLIKEKVSVCLAFSSLSILVSQDAPVKKKKRKGKVHLEAWFCKRAFYQLQRYYAHSKALTAADLNCKRLIRYAMKLPGCSSQRIKISCLS